MDCFVEGPNFLAINPDECIDCGVCIPECPVNAILAQEDIADNAEFWYDLNKRLSKKWPSITRQKAAPADAEHWATQPNKLSLLEE